MANLLLFVVFPYIALVLMVLISVVRYLKRGFTYSSLSSQFLESRNLFFGSVPWHYGILAILAGHLLGFLFPNQVRAMIAAPFRLYFVEAAAFVCGALSLIGLVNLLARRILSSRIRSVTTLMDALILILLFIQVVLGVIIAVYYRWGTAWYTVTAVPYLRSLLLLKPDVASIMPLPSLVKVHILNFYLMTALFPFSRLVHQLVVPLPYLWRPYQLVIWNWDRRKLIKS